MVTRMVSHDCLTGKFIGLLLLTKVSIDFKCRKAYYYIVNTVILTKASSISYKQVWSTILNRMFGFIKRVDQAQSCNLTTIKRFISADVLSILALCQSTICSEEVLTLC